MSCSSAAITAFAEIAHAEAIAGRCILCGQWPEIVYEPGSTYAECRCGAVCVAEFEPMAVARKWNQIRCKCFAPSSAGQRPRKKV